MMVTYRGADLRELPPDPLAHNPDAVPHLTVDARYQVCAMSLYAGSIMVLVRDDTDLPNWYPAQLFRVDDDHLPDDWRFASYSGATHLQALWGYDEIVADESHYDALLERDGEALKIFFSRCGGWLRQGPDHPERTGG